MNNHKKRNILLLFLVWRILFIFFDGVVNKNKEPEKIIYFKNIGIDITQEKQDAKETDTTTIEINMKNKISNQKNYIQDINTLNNLYKQSWSLDILKEIIKKQAQSYNFSEARNSIKELEKNWWFADIHMLLYVFFNSDSLNITEKESIKKVVPLLNSAVENNQIGNQDYFFYAWLIEIWNKNYQEAIRQRDQTKKAEYQPIINSFEKAIRSYDDKKAIPQYYQDGLVALAALKNGYFTIARKIAVETILKDEDYILPYQILAYAHFLTNNRDTAIEYFLKLANFDKQNQETYQFLIWVSYYRKKDYTSSILYLSQNKGKRYQTDTLRYLIINYLEINEQDKAIEQRQRLLGQSDIKNSDFFFYFYNTFYKGYFSQDFSLYNKNKQLSSLFIQECTKNLGIDEDVCIYGRIWKDIIQNNLSAANEVELISLSKKYNQSYLYHILWDFYSKKQQIAEAKKRYAKTVASSQDPREIEFINRKLSNF